MSNISSNTNITLIDANRISSEEGKSNNNDNTAVFTNEISAGLKLLPGDRVSIHSSYINELGCGSQTLETTGKVIGTFNYVYTRFIFEPGQKHIEYGPYERKTVSTINESIPIEVKDNEMVFTTSYYKTVNGENYIHLPRRFDTNINVIGGQEDTDYDEPWQESNVVFMTPANIHNHFDTTGNPNARDPGRNGGGYFSKRTAARKIAWTQHDSATSGQPSYVPKFRVYDDWFYYIGKSAYTGFSAIFNIGTWLYHQSGAGGDEQYWMQFRRVAQDGTIEWDEGPGKVGNPGYDVNEWRQKNDNSKYTLYMMSKTSYVADSLNHDSHFNPYNKLEPCWNQFNRYLELKNYDITPGFNDPNNVAYQLTSQLTDKSEPRTISLTGVNNKAGLVAGETTTPSGPRYDCPISMAIDGEVFKPFACANWYTFSESSFTDYYIGGTTQVATDYLSSYQTIGIKRPEFYDAGNNVISHYWTEGTSGYDKSNPTPTDLERWKDFRIGQITADDGTKPDWINNTYAGDQWLYTTIPWTHDNLLQISKFLKTQELYPETLVFNKRDLFKPLEPANNLGLTQADVPYKSDTPPLSPSLSLQETDSGPGIKNPVYEKRFLHMDGASWDKVDIEPQHIALGPTLGRVDKIGDDGYSETANYNNEDTCSQPVFFHYDRNNENDDETTVTGVDENQLVYGFASKYENTIPAVPGTPGTPAYKVEMIRLYLKDGLPAEMLTEGPDTTPAGANRKYVSGRGIGYDRHFNAYGNSAIILYSGMLPESYDGNEKPLAPSLVGGSTTGKIQRDSTTNVQIGGQEQAWDVSRYIRQIYIGAIKPLIEFDASQSRFVFSGLHTPEYIQNEADAGFIPSTGDQVVDTPDAGTVVYKINKILTMTNNFSPNMIPYRPKNSFTTPIGGTTIKSSFDGKDIVRQTVCGYNRMNQVTISALQPDDYANNRIPPLAWGGEIVQGGLATGTSPAISKPQEYVQSHLALQKFSVFDAQCGIFLEDFGVNENAWDKSIYNILGWNYNQLRSDKSTSYDSIIGSTGALSRQSRFTRANSDKIIGITTNADVGLQDIPLYKMNVWGKSQYTMQLPCPMEPSVWDGWIRIDKPLNDGGINFERCSFYNMINDIHAPVLYPPIVVTQVSTNLTAAHLPIKMRLPYYLIKSNIIADSFYIKDKTPLPIVAVVNKENGFGDFYFSGGSEMVFTITQPITLTFIRTEIFDADMSYASVDKNSGVIYKIEKNVPVNNNLVQDILDATKKKK